MNFHFLQFEDFSQWYYPYLILLGVLLGLFATFFNFQLMKIIRWFRPVKMRWRLLFAGVLTGTLGLLIPEAMGADLSAVESIIEGQDIGFLVTILACKLFLALMALGLGIPGGVIGPVFVLGMLSGALLSLPISMMMGEFNGYSNSFALLGIAGLLTSVLHAPLAALSAVMELSNSPEVILPAMLVIVPAYVTSTQFLKNRSVFLLQLDYQKLSYSISSIRETLQKTGVLAVMDTEFKLFSDAPDKHILSFLETAPTHPVVQRQSYEIDVQYSLVQYDISLQHNASPLAFFNMEGVSSQATLAEVYEILQVNRDGAVYVYDTVPSSIIGVITWNNLSANLHSERY